MQPQTAQQIVDRVYDVLKSKRVDVLAPLTNFKINRNEAEIVISDEKTPGLKGNEDYADAFRRLQKVGYARVQIDGEVYRLGRNP